MFCINCGKKNPDGARFCTECGGSLSGTTPSGKNMNKSRRLLRSTIYFLVEIIIFSLAAYWVSNSNEPKKEYIETIIGFIILIAAATYLIVLIFNIRTLISGIKNLPSNLKKAALYLIHHPAKSISISIASAAAIVALGLLFNYELNRFNEKYIAGALPLIQENLNEAAAAKIMGDSIVVGNPVPGSSMVRVQAAAQLIINRLEFMLIPSELQDYRQAVMDWVKQIASAAENIETWKNLENQPRNFELKISDKEAENLLQDSVNKINAIKEFGDNAIKRKDRITMLYIAAKLMVQEHWLNGVLHSEKIGPFSLAIVPIAKALSFGDSVPDVGQGVDVTCRICSDSSVHMTADQRQMYGCDTRCKSTQNNTQNQQQNQQNQTNNSQNSTQTGKPSSASNPGTGTRKICIGRGGTSYQTNGGTPSNVYCVEDAISTVNEIEASAVGFVEGSEGASDQWNQAWGHAEGGMGVISQGQTISSSGHSPAVQAFFDACQAKGGIVGGAGTVKSGLPTTESGYTCEYKSDTPRNGTQPCWDFLTYSGGRYMGGNTGCPTENLLPTNFDEQKLKELGGKWDGDYPLPGGTISCTGDFAYSIPIPASTGSVRNNVLMTTGGPIPINGNTAIYTISTGQENEGVFVSVSEIDTFSFYQSGNSYGVSATYSGTITALKDDVVKVASCYGSVAGSRH